MKTLIAIAFAVLSVSAFARQTVDFSYNGATGWNQSYYHCDYVEAQTEKVLKLFGASEISVLCTGGLETGWAQPVFVRASFEAPVLVGTEVAKTYKLRGESRSPACGLNTTIVKKLAPKFSNVKIVKKNDSCAFADSNFSYEFSITK